MSAYEGCPFKKGVCLRGASAYEGCPLTRGVRLREVSAYEGCRLTRGVCLSRIQLQLSFHPDVQDFIRSRSRVVFVTAHCLAFCVYCAHAQM